MLSSKTKRELKIDQRQILIDSIEIGISSPHQILTWGERLLPNGKKAGLIKNSKTVNYKRFTPFRDGLFCERIFGPVTSFVCACGKKQPHSKVTFCEKCEVEYIDARSRRYRLGYISLLSPVTHIWYLKGRPSYLSLFLGKRKKTVVALAYCNAYLIEHAISKKNDNVKNGHIWPYMQSPSNSKTFFQGLSNPGKGREERRLKINGSTTPLFGVKNVKKTKTLANKASCYKSPCKALLCTCNKKLCPQTALFAELCSFSLSPKAYPCPCPCPLGKGKGKGKGMGKASRSIPFFHKFSCKRGTRDPRRVSASKSIRCKAVFDERKRETKLESSFSLKLSKKVRFTTFKNFEQNSTNTNSHLVKGKVFSKRKNCHQRFEKKEYLCSEASSYGTYFYARQHTLPFLPTLVSHFYLRDALLNFTYSLASYDDFPIVEYCRIKRREPLRDVHRFMAHRTVEPFKNGINKILPHDALYSYKSITDPKLRFITSTFQPSNKSELFTRKSFTKPYSLKGGKSTLTEKKISSPCCRQKRQHVSLGKNCKAKVPQRYKYKGKEYKSSCVQSSALFAKACKAPRTNLLAYKALLCSRSFALVRKELCTQTALLCASRKKLCDSYARSFVRKRKKVMAWASSAKQSEQISLQSEQISDLYARRFVRFARRFVTSRFVRTCSRSFVLPITLPAHAHASALRARARVRTGAKAKACKKICTPCESTCIGLKSAQVHEISNSCKVTPKIVHASQKSGRRFGCARTCHKVVQNTADFSGNEGPTTLLEESNRSLLSGLELIAIREILSYTGGGALQQLLQQFNQHDFCKFLFAEAQILRRVFETQISSYTSKETDSDFPYFVRGDRKRGTPLPLPLPVPYGQPLPLPKERHGHGNDHGHRHKNELEDLVARSFTWACRTSASTSTNRRFVRRFVRSEGLQSSANKSTCVQSSLQSSALQLLCASRKKLCTCTQGALYANKSTGIVPYGQVATNLRFVKLCKPLCCALDTVNETRSFATLTQEALYARRFVPLARTQICSAWARASRERTKKEDDFQNKTPDLRKKQILRISRRIYKVSRRLKIAQLLTRNHRKPEWMILSHLPVLPPDLRPILQMSEKVIVASDLNIMYQRVIYRNNRHLRVRFIDFHLVTAIQRLVQDAVDRLIENGKGGLKPYYTQGGRPLKSLSDILKGKKGRFRLNLLGKRVDFSGRSVIVVSPLCQIHECGLPKDIALELYHYFLLRQLIVKKYCASIVTAKKMIKSKSSLMWDILRLLMYHHPVLLNRAPTLHRLGIQAFQPKLVLGNAILLHPLVCSGFNADFDGDQMGVHLPLSFAARAESWDLLWSRNNLLSPATGQPMLVPSQDMVLGFYYITAQAYKSTRLVRMQNSSKAKACKAELCSCSRSFALAYKCNYKYKSKICKKICKKLCKEICSPCFALAGKELCTQGALYARSFVRKRKKGMAEARAKVRERTKEKYKSTILHDVNEQKTKINSFLNLKEIITSLQSGKIKLHHPVWLHWRGQIENEEGSQRPLELRVYGFGVQKEVYEKHISLSFFTKNKKDRINLYSPKECVSSYKSSYVVRMQNNCKAPRTTAKLREGLQSEQSGALYARSFVRKKLCTQTNLLAYKEDKKLVNTRLLKAESQPCYLNLSGHEASKSVRKGSDICMAVQHKGKTFAFTEKDKPTPLLQKKRAVSRAEKGSRVSTSDCSSLLKKKRTQLQKQKQQICIKPEAYYVRTTAGRVLMNNLISF